MLLAGCATSTVESRKKERQAAYNALSPAEKELADKGQYDAAISAFNALTRASCVARCASDSWNGGVGSASCCDCPADGGCVEVLPGKATITCSKPHPGADLFAHP